MALLERIISMKQQGISDAQIINTLKEEGITPLQINEAISQSKIKSAIASPEEEMQQSMSSPSPGQDYTQEMPQQQAYAQEQYAQPQQSYSQEQYAQNQQQYPQEQYAQQGYTQGIDIETIKDISKQQVEEAFKKIKEEVSGLSKMKTDVKFEMLNIENRLTQVESIIRELQSAIIRKMGDYGEAISNISQDVRATQQSFAKILNPVLDQKRAMKSEEQTQEETQESKPDNSKKTTRNPAGFENYFR